MLQADERSINPESFKSQVRRQLAMPPSAHSDIQKSCPAIFKQRAAPHQKTHHVIVRILRAKAGMVVELVPVRRGVRNATSCSVRNVRFETLPSTAPWPAPASH